MKRLISLFVLFGFGLATVLSSAYAYDKQGFGPAETTEHVIIMTQDLQSDFSKDSIMLIDTSSKDASATKHIKGSVTMSMNDIALQIEEGSLDGKTLFLINTDHLTGKTSNLGLGISLLLYALAAGPAAAGELVGNMFELLGIPVNMNRPLDFLPPLYGSYFADINIGSRDSFSHSAEDAGFQMFALPVDTFIDTIADESVAKSIFDNKSLSLLYDGATKGGVRWTGFDIIGALCSVVIYVISLPATAISELLPIIFEGMLGIDVDYNQPIKGFPALDGNLLGWEAGWLIKQITPFFVA